MNTHYTTIKKFLAGNKYAWPSHWYNAILVFNSKNKANNLFDLLFCYEFYLDLDFLTDSEWKGYIDQLRDDPMMFGFGDSVKYKIEQFYGADNGNNFTSIHEQFNKHILLTWCFDKIKFSAGVRVLEYCDNNYKSGSEPAIGHESICSLYYYIFNKKYSYEMYLLLQDRKNIFLPHRAGAMWAFGGLEDFNYDCNIEFETLFFPKLQLIWQLLDLPMQQLFYIHEKK